MKHVVVVGFGLAGGLIAIELANQGIRVTLLEKMSMPGGISITAGGGVRCSNNAEKTLQYLQSTSAGTVPNEVLKSFADSMTRIHNRLVQLAKINNSTVTLTDNEYLGMPVQHYGFEGWESLDMVSVTDTPDVDYDTKYPQVVAGNANGAFGNAGGLNGVHLFNVVYDNVMANKNITVCYNTAVRRLMKEDNSVTGVETESEQIFADAVVLATGGFENCNEMKSQYWQGKPVLNNGFFGNTGDGIRMAQAAGSDLWHMWHYHGTYGFKHPAGFGVRIKGANIWCPTVEGSAKSSRELVHIVVDKNGRRFMNEYPPYITDHAHRPMEWFSPEEVRYPRIPAYFISDEHGRSLGPWGSIRANLEGEENYYWSDDNLQEISQGIFKRCDTVEELAEYIGCDANTLASTLDNYNNDVCVNGDSVYHRPTSSLTPIDKPPYYVAEVYPIVGNTQGGPRKNQHFQVVNPFGDPIPGLFTTGECGSIWGHVYMSAGNFAECFVGSEIISRYITQS